MAVRLIERKVGYLGCDGCSSFKKIVSGTGHSSYKLYGFCYEYTAWVTLLDDKDLPILKCERHK